MTKQQLTYYLAGRLLENRIEYQTQGYDKMLYFGDLAKELNVSLEDVQDIYRDSSKLVNNYCDFFIQTLVDNNLLKYTSNHIKG